MQVLKEILKSLVQALLIERIVFLPIYVIYHPKVMFADHLLITVTYDCKTFILLMITPRPGVHSGSESKATQEVNLLDRA